MKAIIYTTDTLSYEVLERALKAYSVQSCERRTERDIKITEDDEMIIFLDFDDAGFATMRPLLPPYAIMVAIGSYETQKASRGYAELNFITKPFSKANLDQMLRKVILKQVSFALPSLPSGEVDIEAIKKDINQRIENLKQHRRKFGEMLLVPPAQLKDLLMLQAVNPEEKIAASQIPGEVFPFRRALLIEGEDVNIRLLSRYLINKCVLQTDIAVDGQEAWQKIKQYDYEVVILSWEIDKVSGLALYNRMRAHTKYRYRPILVMSNVLSASDFRLCDEDFAAGLLEKPVAEKTFSTVFEQVAGNSIVSQKDQEGLFNAVCHAIEAGIDFTKALTTTEVDPVLLNALRLAGDFFVALNQFDQAVAAFGTAWQLGDRRLCLLTGYGKATYLAGDTLKGRQILAQADFLTPGNIERLCLLGEIDLCLKNPERAREKFLAALNVDKHYKRAQAGLNVAETLMEERDKDSIPMDSTRFASYLNMVGITLAHKGQSDKAVKYYNSAMVFIRSETDLVKLWFNVGLCYLRAQLPAKAEHAFKKAYTLSGGTFKLAAKYLSNKNTKQMANKIRFEEI